MYSDSGLKIMEFLKAQIKTDLPKEDWQTIMYAITQYWDENADILDKEYCDCGRTDDVVHCWDCDAPTE